MREFEARVGIALAVFFVACLLTLIAARVVARRYARQVDALIREQPDRCVHTALTKTEGRPRVRLEVIDAPSLPPTPGTLVAAIGAAEARALWIYGTAGILHGVIASVLLLATAPNVEWASSRRGPWFLAAVAVFVNLFPVVLAVNIVVARTAVTIAATVIYVVITIAIGPILSSLGAERTDMVPAWLFGVALWLGLMLPPTAAAAVIVLPRARAITPALLTIVTATLIGVAAAVSGVHPVAAALSTSIVISAGAAAVALLAWLYRTKRLSDRGLTLDAWWAVFTLGACMFPYIELGVAGLTVIAGFVVYVITSRVGFTWARRSLSRDGPGLLILRVFHRPDSTDRFFRAVANHWRYIGPVFVIAGTDVALSAATSSDYIDFLRGRLRDRFIRHDSDLAALALDDGRDPDLRFRVNQFFCQTTAWRRVIAMLITQVEYVAVDLRGFSKSNEGCTYELRVIADRLSLRKVILLVDESTHHGDLEEELAAAIAVLDPRSVNAGIERVWAVSLPGGPRRDARPLIHLFDWQSQAGGRTAL